MQKSIGRRQTIIGVMGGANISAQAQTQAYHLGRLIAENGWVLLNGGRNCGIMDASAKGACEHGGITVGILPGKDLENISEFIQIPILTGMGNARNCINALSSDIVVACNGGAGTISEIALALKEGKYVILMGISLPWLFDEYRGNGSLISVQHPSEVIDKINAILSEQDQP